MSSIRTLLVRLGGLGFAHAAFTLIQIAELHVVVFRGIWMHLQAWTSYRLATGYRTSRPTVSGWSGGAGAGGVATR